MRGLWPENTPYWLNGEVDKSGHAIIRERGGDFAKPDFLIHIPGEMAGNFAIMEVKAVHARGAAIHDDLHKLSLFVSAIDYRRAVYLSYGYQDDEVLLERVNRQLLKLDNPQNIEI